MYVDLIFRPVIRFLLQQCPGLTYQYDNSHPHVARVTWDFLAKHQCSPECNPIRHTREVLGRWLRKCQRQPSNVRELVAALREVWARIPRFFLHNLCDSLRRRLDEVIARRGGYTGFYHLKEGDCVWFPGTEAWNSVTFSSQHYIIIEYFECNFRFWILSCELHSMKVHLRVSFKHQCIWNGTRDI